MIGILDYGMGNVGSIQNMLKHIGYDSVITRDPEQVDGVDKLILPGVGAFDEGMRQVRRLRLEPLIRRHALEKQKPLLGICLGMQLLGTGSEEGSAEGLSLLPFRCVRFQPGDSTEADYKIPHMGWDRVEICKPSPLTDGLEGPQRFYFVHSYYARCTEEDVRLLACDYGVRFAAAVSRGNIYGTQFHPEKSHRYGMALLKNFAARC